MQGYPKSIGVIGGGTVGKATARTYLEFVDQVRVYDIIPELATHSLEETLNADLVFVCLPTPGNPNGELDTWAIEAFFEKAVKIKPDAKFVLRSTVPVGTTQRLAEKFNIDVVHSPEFLTARCADIDAKIPAQNVIGQVVDKSQTAFWLCGLYCKRFPGIRCYLVDSNDSEAAKLLLNSLFAVKVAFFNEAYQWVTNAGQDWDNVRKIILNDGRITAHHTLVPGHDGCRGFGGECLPKDLANLVYQIEQNGLSAAVTRAAMERNKEDRKL